MEELLCIFLHIPLKFISPRSKGKLIGQKPPFKLKEIRSIRIRLQLSNRILDLALFNLTINGKLRGCDLVKLRVLDVAHGDHVAKRAMVMQQKTKQPVQFEITEQTREAISNWINHADLSGNSQLFPSRLKSSPHISIRQYARIVKSWVSQIGLDPAAYDTHSLRRTKATLIYRRTKNLRAVQLLLGTPNWKALFGISELKSMTLWKWPRKLKFN